MAISSELTIEILAQEENNFTVQLHIRPEENEPERVIRKSVTLPLDYLNKQSADPREYGSCLFRSLFADAMLLEEFQKIRGRLQGANGTAQSDTLRIRLVLPPQLQHIRWETLCDPETDEPLFTNPRIFFSRFLSPLDFRPVRMPGSLKVLAVISNPSNLSQDSPNGIPLAPIDVKAELERIKNALPGANITPLISPGRATADNIVRSLRDVYDVIYFVCHGALVEGKPYIWLENDDGQTDRVAGEDLVRRIAELHLPALAVLASCQSAGNGRVVMTAEANPLTALGPLMAEAGIPSVIAAQGNLSMDTSAKFMPMLFNELQQKGDIDRAVALARSSLDGYPDFWMPVLFTRLKKGRLWQTEAVLQRNTQDWKKWDGVLSSIAEGQCTPILGPGLAEAILGSSHDIAQEWTASLRSNPLTNEADLPQVAQYVALTSGDQMPKMLTRTLRGRMLQMHRQLLTEKWGQAAEQQNLEEMVSYIGKSLRLTDASEPHRLLAQMGMPLYLTASPFSLISDALKEAGRLPHIQNCLWNAQTHDNVPHNQNEFQPDKDNPLVYHLFGHISDPVSVVLKEDDYFHYLIGFARNTALMPSVVRTSLANSNFLFLGFQLEDWKFRILFHSILSLYGKNKRGNKVHVAVQVDPSQPQAIDPNSAREYLNSYFEDVDIYIYWDNAANFIGDLWKQL